MNNEHYIEVLCSFTFITFSSMQEAKKEKEEEFRIKVNFIVANNKQTKNALSNSKSFCLCTIPLTN